MDPLILNCVDRYKALVKSLNSRLASKAPKVASGEQNSKMVVCARIRPLMDDEAAAGFPCAVYPRHKNGVVDIHDMSLNPRRVLTLKVRLNSRFPFLAFPITLMLTSHRLLTTR